MSPDDEVMTIKERIFFGTLIPLVGGAVLDGAYFAGEWGIFFGVLVATTIAVILNWTVVTEGDK